MQTGVFNQSNGLTFHWDLFYAYRFELFNEINIPSNYTVWSNIILHSYKVVEVKSVVNNYIYHINLKHLSSSLRKINTVVYTCIARACRYYADICIALHFL